VIASLSPEDLSAIADAVIERLRPLLQRGPDHDTRLLTRAGLASALGVSTSQVHRWHGAGCPCVVIGSKPRYRLGDVTKWLESRPTTPRGEKSEPGPKCLSRVK
jgi:hypothetical protein